MFLNGGIQQWGGSSPSFQWGGKQVCSYYGGIRLIDTAAKVFGVIIPRHFFWLGRTCTDQIHNLRCTLQQRLGNQQETVMWFVDFASVFESVHRESVWRIMATEGISHKLLKQFSRELCTWLLWVICAPAFNYKMPHIPGFLKFCAQRNHKLKRQQWKNGLLDNYFTEQCTSGDLQRCTNSGWRIRSRILHPLSSNPVFDRGVKYRCVQKITSARQWCVWFCSTIARRSQYE